ncbi:MAG TPA: YceD family protein [Gallionella sp.]|nr:YceD family protein [Gallionella sp.]
MAELSRLHDLLEDMQGQLKYTVRGGLDNQGHPFLDISIGGSCRLRCQRCLQGMEYPVELETRLMLCDQAELDALEDDEEEVDSILAETHLDVLNLLEEEILLSLPFAPRHEPGGCSAADEGNVTRTGEPPKEEKNPFAVLAKLKRSL